MLDIIRIRKEGFPIHMRFEDFITRYYCLSKTRLPADARNAAKIILEGNHISKTEWQLGRTKVFMRSYAHEPLEDGRSKMLITRAIIIQRNYRKYIKRRDYLIIRNAVLQLQHAYRGWKQRIQFLRMRRAAIVIQSHLRGVFAREVAAALREMRRVEEEMRKREKLEEERRAREAELAEMAEREQKQLELEQSERAAQKEIATLSHMAEQLKPHLVEQTTEAVDLDNLFAFLSDVQPNRNQIIDEIGEKMDELVEDLDVELETVIQQELEGLAQEQQQQQQLAPPKLGLPTLPEPTEPPPPPPPTTETVVQEKHDDDNEPIYEAVLPREESSCVSPPPLPAPPKLPVDSPKHSPPPSRASSTGVSNITLVQF